MNAQLKFNCYLQLYQKPRLIHFDFNCLMYIDISFCKINCTDFTDKI